jgi:sugar O-acyltransferase (sialic acid O-acetyltransferase NeuD family)
MVENFIIWGSAGHSLVLSEIIEGQGGRVIALFDNDSSARSLIFGVPVYFGQDSFRQWLKMNPSIPNLAASVAIGGSKGRERQEISKQFKIYGIPMPPIIHPSSSVSKSAKIDVGTHVLANTVVASNVVIGKDCIVNNSANVDHETVLESGVHIAPGAVLCGCVYVGENTLIGAGAVILPRIRVGKNSIIGAGAVVTKNVPNDVVVAGNPAVFLKKRCEDA